MKRCFLRAVAILAIFLAGQAPLPASAQGGHGNHGGGALGEILEGGCEQLLGPNLKVAMSAYPAESYTFQALCGTVPEGRTFLTFDLLDAPLREMPIAVEVVKILPDTSQGPAIASKEAALYPKGAVEMLVDFTEPGEYAVILNSGGHAGHHPTTARFPLHVGSGLSPIVLGLIVAGLLAAAGGAYWAWRRRAATTSAA